VTATYEQARDDIFTLIKAAWDPTGYLISWPDDSNKALPPAAQTPWARVQLFHGSGLQQTLSGETGARRFNRGGVLIVQVFAPRGDGLSRAYQLAKIVADGVEGRATPRQVWFRNVRITEVGPDGNFSQVNVLADFTYDEVK